MSDEELDDWLKSAPSNNTRHKDYTRRPFTPIEERMSNPNITRRTKTSHSSKLIGSPKLPRSPKSTGRSPQSRRRAPVKNKLYPNLPGNEDNTDESTANSSQEEEGSDYTDEDDDSRHNVRRVIKKDPRDVPSRGKKLYPQLDHIQNPPKKQGQSVSNQKSNDNKSKSSMGTCFWILAFIVASVVIQMVMYKIHVAYQKPDNTEMQGDIQPLGYDLFEPYLDKIKMKYPSQTRRFWKIVQSQMKRLLNQEAGTYPAYPAVVLLSVPKKSSNIGTCFTNDFISSLNDAFNSTNTGYVNMVTLIKESGDAGKIKQALDNQLIRNLENGRGVVLDHIEELPAPAALLLHGYCDGDNAPYKQSAIVLGLHTDMVHSDQHEVDAILTEMWESDLGADEMPALLSRIGNNVVVLSHEPNFKC